MKFSALKQQQQGHNNIGAKFTCYENLKVMADDKEVGLLLSLWKALQFTTIHSRKQTHVRKIVVYKVEVTTEL